MRLAMFSVTMLSAASLAAVPTGPRGVEPPDPAFSPPAWDTAEGAPQIFEHSQEAGPDETLFLVGTNLTKDVFVWGHHTDDPKGKSIPVKVQLATNGYLAVTVPDNAFDGPKVLTVKNAAGYSEPIVINAPQPWWCSPETAVPGMRVRLFGRNLACRPDGYKACIWLTATGQQARKLEVGHAGKYEAAFTLPADVKPGTYEIWLHGGRGGAWGWGSPLRLTVRKPESRLDAAKKVRTMDDVQRALDAMARRGGGTVRLPVGHFTYNGTLRVPAHVTLAGAGRETTLLEQATSPAAAFARFEASGWGLAPGAIHTRGDKMTYEIEVPQSGQWHVWLRYGTDMSPWKQTGVSGNSTIRVDDGKPIILENLPNTGGFGTFKWSESATLEIKAGRHTLVWQNTNGGGMSLDAFVLVLGHADAPVDKPWPSNSATSVVIQGEECVRFECKEGTLPRSNRAAVWLSGDGASLSDLTVQGNAQVNHGIAIRAAGQTEWVNGCSVQRVRIADCEGKQAENCGVYVRQLRGGSVSQNELWGRTPLFLSGARDSVFSSNRLVSITRYGGNSEAAILGRCEPIERCVIEDNMVASPPGAEAGGPTARRLIWLSTGHGSITHNWLARNGVEAPGTAGQPRFGGVAGTDQNVGEMILFEGNHRTMYFGPLAGADRGSVTLPRTLPITPEYRLGSVKRDQLAHDKEGLETPFWPPDADDGTGEPPLGEYYVTVFAGPGQGQTRRAVSRSGERVTLDKPWRISPQAGSVVAIGTMFYRNLIVNNHTPDGMTGIQLWISCVENVVAGNTIERQRKPGLFLYANGTTLASSMPRTWNRGISPLFWNLVEGNRTDECSDGALVTSGDAPSLPVEFPRALGNVLRHNSFIRSRQNAVIMTSRKSESGLDTSASVVGTIAEFNVARDTPVAFHTGAGSDGIVLRRNHAYAWHPINNATEPAIAFQFDSPATAFAMELNSVEGKVGTKDTTILETKKSWEK